MRVRSPAAREGGFAMIIVLVLLIMLVGVAMILLSTSRGDVFGATNERESAIAFYAAEAGIAHGKSAMAAYPYNDGTRYTGLIAQKIANTIDFGVNDAGATIPARYEVTFINNADGPTDGGASMTDLDGILIIRSVGYGPNNSRAVIQVAAGIKDQFRVGVGYCAQANPPPSCRGQ